MAEDLTQPEITHVTLKFSEDELRTLYRHFDAYGQDDEASDMDQFLRDTIIKHFKAL